jgi:hypothetical protein
VRKHSCSNCAQPLRALSLTGHYGRQVEVDVCDPCCLIWFDDVESVRIAKPGIAELVRVVHAAMAKGEGHGGAASLAARQQCPVCRAALRQVYNASRYGRTSQLQCPNGHGYYQSYILYLAEKGYLRPVIWADIRALAESARELFCSNCGGVLELRPQEACPYCRSAIAVLDPARLSEAVDASQADEPASAHQQACHACGGPVDPTRDASCPQCHAVLRRKDLQSAMDVVSRPRRAVDRKDMFKNMDAVLERPVVAAPKLPVELNSIPRRIVVMAGIMALMFAIRACGGRDGGETAVADPVQRIEAREAALAEGPAAAPAPAPADECPARRRTVRLRAVSLHGVEGSPGLLDRVHEARAVWEGGMPYATVVRNYQRDGLGPPLFAPGITPGLDRGAMPAPLAEAAFCLRLQQISQPIYSNGSYYLLQVMSADY